MGPLDEFIEQVHREPYNLLVNNCLGKSSRIVRRARDLGHDARLMACVAIVPRRPLPFVAPHFYAEVDGGIVDVAMDPAMEAWVCRNEELVRLAPIEMPLN